MPEYPVALSALVTRIRRMVEDSPEQDTITAALSTATQTNITVATPRLYGKGATLEIEDELLYTLTEIAGYTTTVARGHRYTTPATHISGSAVYINPRYTRANIKEAINVVTGNWISFYAPQLVWDTTTGGSFQSSRDIYPVASDAIGVRRVAYLDPGRTSLVDVQHGPVETFPTALASTGKGVQVFDQVSGRTVYVLYTRPWPQMETDAATLPVDFPVMMDNLVTDGAVLYLLGWRLTPKFKLDETVFSREQGESLPTNFNAGMMNALRSSWIAGVHRMQAMRAQPSHPRRVIVD